MTVKKIVTSVITKDEFVEAMTSLKKKHDKCDKVFDALYEDIGECDKLCDVIYGAFDDAIEQLSQRMNDDTTNRWGTIEWFIYDNNWGQSGLTIGIDGKDYEVNDYGQLWDIMTEVNN